MRVLIHVEDPGAANWMVPLIGVLGDHDLHVIAEGAAQAYLADRDVDAQDWPGKKSASVLLDDIRPDAVIAGTAENLESRGLDLIDLARLRGIPSASPIDQAANAAHRFRGRSDDPRRHAPDLLFLPDEAAAEAFRKLGFPEFSLAITGNPHHARLAATVDALAAVDAADLRERVAPDAGSRPLIVFLAEIGYVVNPEAEDWEREFSFSGRNGTAPRAPRMLEELIDALDAAGMERFLVLRLHPKNSADEFAGTAGAVDLVSQGGDPLPLVHAADLVVGLSGSLLEEAHLMGKRCLSILPHPVERDWLQGLASGAIPAATNRQELRAMLPAILAAPPPAPAALRRDASDTMLAALNTLVGQRAARRAWSAT